MHAGPLPRGMLCALQHAKSLRSRPWWRTSLHGQGCHYCDT